VIEVFVGQHHMRHTVSGDLVHIGVDRGCFCQRGSGVDEQRARSALHQTDGDVEKR
jgi:hypothetical protein